MSPNHMSPKEEGSAAVFYAAASTLLAHLRLFERAHPDSVCPGELRELYALFNHLPKGIRALDESTIPDLINYVRYRVREISSHPFGADAAPFNHSPESASEALRQLYDTVDTLEWMCGKEERKRLARPPKSVAYIVPWHKKVIRAVLEWAWRFGE